MSAATLVRDLTAFSIQIALIVAAVALLVKAIQIPARARYHGLRLALAAALIVPWLLRATDAPRPAVAEPATQVLLPPGAALSMTPVPNEASTAVVEPRFEIPWLLVLLGVVGIGVAGRGLWLAAGLVRLRQMTKAGAVVDEPEYSELQEQIGARATIAQVAGLAQPATFGVRRPVVLLPDALAAAPRPLCRAVIIHELYHVRRRDWLFLLMEEVVRTVFWFHPAILWLTSHIQLAREEIVDELTVHATGDRRGYMQALLTFADSGGLRPAPAFARRRQLFHRILSVSKEKVMSRPRIVLSAAVLVAVVFSASWSASLLFPIVKAAPQVTAERPNQSQIPVLSPAPQTTAANTQRETRAQSVTSTGDVYGFNLRGTAVLIDQRTGETVTPHSVTPENPIPRRTRGVPPASPSRLPGQAASGQVTMLVTIDRNGGVVIVTRDTCSVTSSRDRESDCGAFYEAAASAIRQWRYERPAQAPLQFTVIVTFRPGTEPAIAQAASDWLKYVRETQDSLRVLGAAATRESLRSELFELTNKSRELERAYRIESERYRPGHPVIEKLQAEMDTLNALMAALREKLQTVSGAPNEVVLAQQQVAQTQAQIREVERQLEQLRRERDQTATVDVRPTPPAAFDGPPQLRSPSGRAPVRITPGVVAAPRVIKSVHPSYTAEAMHARIEGTVQVEALIDEQGRVADARVVKSLPLLDEMALAAARQWEFSPTLLNGQPVPVLVMLELHFALR